MRELLIVEDSHEITSALIDEFVGQFRIITCDRSEEVATNLPKDGGVIILDMSLGQTEDDGKRICQYLREAYDDEPFPWMIIGHSAIPRPNQATMLRPFGVKHFRQKMDIDGIRACIAGTCDCHTIKNS